MLTSLREHFPINMLCEVLDVPRSSVYYKNRTIEERPIREALVDAADQWPTYGYLRLTAMLKRQGYVVNAKRIRRLMHELGIAGEPRKIKPRTTDSGHAYPRYPNLVQDMKVIRSEQVWVADITSIRLRKEFIYLAVVMDVFTRCVRGRHLGPSLEHELTMTALRKAFKHGRPEINHSDQGVQCAATAYVELVLKAGSAISMASVGEPRENGYAERLMRTIKEEEVDPSEYEDLADARRRSARFLDDVYNTMRIHSALGYLMHQEFEQGWNEDTSMDA